MVQKFGNLIELHIGSPYHYFNPYITLHTLIPYVPPPKDRQGSFDLHVKWNQGWIGQVGARSKALDIFMKATIAPKFCQMMTLTIERPKK